MTGTLSPAGVYRSWKGTSLLFAAGNLRRKRGSEKIGSVKKNVQANPRTLDLLVGMLHLEQERRRTYEIDIFR